ncbi:hypothetical protein AB0A74_09670 [Saccharothrix sp. NPDC042600]|uniref:hypothetical protein n=1 Tax=Saccharothrix TaxID=2071 RepID=UPI0033DB00FD
MPRDMVWMPALTTNVEFGLDIGSGKVVLGAPPDCPAADRNRYLIYVGWRRGDPVRETLLDTVSTALQLLRAG